MPANTDRPSQAKRKRAAFQSTLLSCVTRVAVALALISLGIRNHSGTTLGAVMIVIAVLNLGTIIPAWIVYKS